MNLIFGNDDGEGDLLMRAPLKHFFGDLGVGESRKCESTCSKNERNRLTKLSLWVGFSFLGAPFV